MCAVKKHQTNNYQKSKHHLDTVCQTAYCNEESEMFTRMMDLEADPCEDFSQFMCGKLYQKRIEPGDIRETSIAMGEANKKRKW